MTGSQILQDKITLYAERSGSKEAIIEAETGRLLTYGELFWAVNALRRKWGENPQTILLELPGGIVNSLIWLAALTGGHRLVPVSAYLTEYEITQIVKKHQPDIIISNKNLAETEGIIQNPPQANTFSLPAPHEGHVFLSTSGSTGTPKGVLLSAKQIVLTADNIRKSHRITRQDRGLTPLPFYHVNAPVVSLMTSIICGSTLIVAPKYSTNHFWEWVEKYNPSWISLVPTMIAMLLNTDRPNFLDHAGLRFIRTASEPLPAENLKRFEAKFKIPLIETYGLSEAASTVAANPVPPGKHKPGSVGLPLGVEVCIFRPGVDETITAGKTGEVCVKGANIIKHYSENASPGSFFQGWLRTGDLGFIDNDGYIHLTGRIKDIIIRGGENIAPREIEEVLLAHPSVREVTVVGLPDPIYGEQVAAFVVLQKAPDGKVRDEIRSYAVQKLIPHKLPSEIFILDDLPRNKTGKVDKIALKEMAAGMIRQDE